MHLRLRHRDANRHRAPIHRHRHRVRRLDLHRSHPQNLLLRRRSHCHRRLSRPRDLPHHHHNNRHPRNHHHNNHNNNPLPTPTTNLSFKTIVRTPTINYGGLYLANTLSGTNLAVTCTNTAGIVSCVSLNGAFDSIFSCGAYMYLGKATWAQAGCTKVNFRISA